MNNETLKFIQENKNDSLANIALKIHNQKLPNKEYILNQINGLQKIQTKLKEWVPFVEIEFPSKISFEQCSSSETGLYKSSIISKGLKAVDLTGGFGVDSYFFSKVFNLIYHIERNSELSKIAEKNFSIMGIQNCEFINKNSIEWIKEQQNIVFDLIYIDPARRDQTNNKLTLIEDCEPNIIEIFPILISKCKQLLIKLSPMLDIKSCIQSIEFIKEIHVVSVKNECKEILLLIELNHTNSIIIKTVDIKNSESQEFDFKFTENNTSEISYSEPLEYLYEPNASIMKSGGFKELAIKFNLPKLSPNTHLYTSNHLVEGFPGRKFKILYQCEYSEKAVKNFITTKKANITARNFGETVEQIRKKLKLNEGGEYYIFATSTLSLKKTIIICSQL